ncbi:MAG: hypothetical protein ACRCZI_09465, partial [Cetobacterium sp.]
MKVIADHDAAIEWCAQELYARREASGNRLPKGTLVTIIQYARERFGLDESQVIKPKTIESRVMRSNFKGRMRSPMEAVEEVLNAFTLQLEAMGQPLDEESFLELANSFIDGTPTQAKMMAWKKTSGLPEEPLGKRYYAQYKQRNAHIVKSLKPSKKDANRQEWATFANFKLMYDKIYETMVEEGIARKLDTPVFKDRDSNVVDADKAFGLPVDIELLYPERV